jgi:hypothetical protein
MVLNRLGDKRGTNLSNLVRFNEAMKTRHKMDKMAISYGLFKLNN